MPRLTCSSPLPCVCSCFPTYVYPPLPCLFQLDMLMCTHASHVWFLPPSCGHMCSSVFPLLVVTACPSRGHGCALVSVWVGVCHLSGMLSCVLRTFTHPHSSTHFPCVYSRYLVYPYPLHLKIIVFFQQSHMCPPCTSLCTFPQFMCMGPCTPSPHHTWLLLELSALSFVLMYHPQSTFTIIFSQDCSLWLCVYLGG